MTEPVHSSTVGQQSSVSVDVLALRFERTLRDVVMAIAPRPWDPYIGAMALPGVLLGIGERLVEAAQRAVIGKLGVPAQSVLACGQLATFDEPNRDPRGPTLSLAMWAVVSPDSNAGPATRWVNLEHVPEMPFDHNRIVDDSRPVLSRLLWRDIAFTRALTGDRFPVGDAVDIQASLDGRAPDRGNLNRLLRGIAQLSRTDERRLVHGTGRPSTVWQWDGEQPDG